MSEMMLASGYDRRKNPERKAYRPMTPAEALLLTYGQRIHFLSKDGTVRDLKVNGKVRTWKRDPSRIEVPCKYGMYECATFEARDGEMIVPASGVMLLVVS
jgi:hypothetical protein